MTLLQHIKRERTQQRKKQPLKQDVFNTISGLVRRYGLDDNFLRELDNAGDNLSKLNLEITRVRSKPHFEFPLFSLATKEEYNLTMAILRKVDNPYLQFVKSPEEILLCELLFSLNPLLSPEILMSFHFETLLSYERDSSDLL